MNAYLKLIEQIYPARNCETPDILIYNAMEVAYAKMQLERNISETVLYNYRIAFYFLKEHIKNAVNDGMRKISYELNELDRQCLIYFLNKLDSSIYDKIEIDVIVDNINTLLSCYDLSKNYAFIKAENEEQIIKLKVSA
ncbi:hypothetical protein [Pedobacter sp. Leaf170]|uniref:hypothetical protein n=1 Tax=Pedobacter sp. Leaf170 TaxID=2876558 RepID=UPI001E59BDC7|nr:hypothetical protein [Pedobacter sp. Leaf170]